MGSTLIAAGLVETLDRRFQALERLEGKSYLLHLIAFSDFVESDPEIAPYAEHLKQRFLSEFSRYEQACRVEVGPLVAYRTRLAAAYPYLDDSDAPPPKDLFENRAFESTLAHFDDLVAGRNRLRGESLDMSNDPYLDRSIEGQLIRILKAKLRQEMDREDAEEKTRRKKNKKARRIPKKLDALWVELRNIEEDHSHRFRYFTNLRRTSPGQALINVKDISERLNRRPSPVESIYDRTRSFNDVVGYAYLNDVLYTDQVLEHLPRLVGASHAWVAIAYSGLRETIGRLGARVQVMQRYKNRCMWYDAATLRDLADTGRERGLTRHLALFLFDQGIPVMTMQRLGVHEADVVSLGEASILVEAKYYHAGQPRSRIAKTVVNGFFQLHAYLNGVEAASSIQEAYLVVFRRGGPLVDMPYAVHTPRFTIYPVVIDIGEAVDSGRRQPKPIVIGEDVLELGD